MVVNEKSEFKEDNFQKAMGMLSEKQGEDPASAMAGRNKKGKTKKGGATKGEAFRSILKRIFLISVVHFQAHPIFSRL